MSAIVSVTDPILKQPCLEKVSDAFLQKAKKSLLLYQCNGLAANWLFSKANFFLLKRENAIAFFSEPKILESKAFKECQESSILYYYIPYQIKRAQRIRMD